MSRGINGFQSTRLSQILAARRLTQAQLAALVGVSAPTVSKWRSGQQAPEADALERLATVVNVSPEWFTRPVPQKVSAPLFRSNASAHIVARHMLEARVEWTQDLVLGLSDFVELPIVSLPDRNFFEPEQISPGDIEDAAIECRTLWGLGRGPIANLALAVESAGVILVREETGIAQIEGLSTWSSALTRPIIFLSSDKDNAFRSRFDLGHELGHLLLHKHIPRATERERHNQMEKQAHRFAGAILLPAESFAAEIRTPVTLDSLLLVKQRWGVSVAAIIMRLEALGIIDDDEKQVLFKRRSARWGVKSEPGDDSRTPETPRLLRRTIDLLVSSGILPLEAISRHFGLSENDIEMIAGLPYGYLAGTAKVINLPDFRKSNEPGYTIDATRNNASVIAFNRNKR